MVKDIATGLLFNAQKKTAKEPATGAILLPFSFAMDKPTLTAGGERARAASFAIIRWMKTACFSLWGDALATPTGSARQVLEPEKD